MVVAGRFDGRIYVPLEVERMDEFDNPLDTEFDPVF